MSYQLVKQLQKKAIPVVCSCRLLEVSRSGYYDAARLCQTGLLQSQHPFESSIYNQSPKLW